MGSTGMQGDHTALPEGDLSVPQPCLPHLSLYSPDPSPLLLSRSVFFRCILSGNDAKCHPQVIEQLSNPQPLPYFQCMARWSFLSLFWGSAYLWGSFGLCEVEMDSSLSLVDYFPEFLSSPRRGGEISC